MKQHFGNSFHMQILNLIFGIILFTLFLITGIYMLTSFPEIYSGSPEKRMMYRANHIYILFASLINILSGLVRFNVTVKYRKIILLISSALFLIGGTLLAAAFFIEPAASSWERPFTFFGVVCNLSGVILIAINHFLSKK